MALKFWGTLLLGMAIVPASGCGSGPGAASPSPSAVATTVPDGCAGSALGYFDGGGYPLLANQQCTEQGQPKRLAGFNTWRWDGARWVLLVHENNSPYAYSNMVYDPDLKMTVEAGGILSPREVRLMGWDGSKWSIVPGEGQPDLTSGDQTLVYDQQRHLLVLYQGSTQATWTFDGHVWSQAAGAGPQFSSTSAFAFNPLDGTSLLVACAAQPCNNLETWIWDGAFWTQAQPTTKPPLDFGNDLAFDPSADQMVLVASGGSEWTWDGADWSRSAIQAPPGGGIVTLLYDRLKRELLYWTSPSSVGSKMWAFRKGAWTQVAGATP